MKFADSEAIKMLEILQKIEQERYVGKKIAELSEDELIQFYDTKLNCGKLAYQCYQVTKQSHEYTKSIQYFILALEYENSEANSELEAAYEKLEHSSFDLKDKLIKTSQTNDNFILGMKYLLGIGRTKNKDAALIALEWAAQDNHAQAQYQLACLLLKSNKEKAMFWLSAAANQGYRAAESLLATIFKADNEGKLLQDPKYYNYLLNAAEKGDINAQYNLAHDLEIDVDDIANSPHQALIIKWYQLSALQGVIKAQYSLAMIYKVLGKLDDAFKWFTSAASKDDVPSSYELGLMYESGHGAPQSLKVAEQCYLLGACAGHAESQFRLACIYSANNKSDASNLAARWFRCAAEQQHNEAIQKLLEGDAVSYIYHSLMVQGKIDEAAKLLDVYHDELITEVFEDLKFPMFSIKSHAKTLQVANKLSDRGIVSKKLSLQLNHYYLNQVFRINKESERHDIESLQLLLEHIVNIDAASLDKEVINKLVTVIIDICYQLPKNRQVMGIVTQVLIKLIIRSYSIGTLSTIPERQNCIFLLVSNLNPDYEHNMLTQLTDAQLFSLSSICMLNNQSSIKAIHEVLGVAFIINRREENIRRFVTQLQKYLIATLIPESSPLHDFKLLLNQELLSAEPNSQKIFLKLYQIIMPSLKIKGNSFFSDNLDNSEQFKTFCERLINSQDNALLEFFEQLKTIGSEIPAGPH